MGRLSPDDTEKLINRIQTGDLAAVNQLLDRHRARLKQMVKSRLDRRLAARIDPSDVVQDTLADAAGKLPHYLEHRPLPFYPWLRQLAWNRLTDLYRAHVTRQRRSVKREEKNEFLLSDESIAGLARRLVSSATSPSNNALRNEMLQRVRTALEGLPSHFREVLIMRHLEQMSVREIATIADTKEGTIKSRLARGLALLSHRLDGPS